MRNREFNVNGSKKKTWILIGIVTVLMVTPETTKGMTCKVSRSVVFEEEPFAVSCIYNNNNHKNKTFSIKRNETFIFSCDYNGGELTCDKCRWRLKGEQSPECRIDPDGNMTEVRLLFTRANYFKDNGTYICEVDGNGPGTIDSCRLQVKEKEPSSTCKVINATFFQCQFNHNITAHKRDVTVVKEITGPLGEHTTTESILDCSWRNGRHECNSKSSWHLAAIGNYTLNLRVAAADESVVGKYFCMMHTSVPSTTSPCNLTLEKPEDVAPSHPSTASMTEGVIIAISLAVISIIVHALALFFNFRTRLPGCRRKCTSKNESPGRSQEELKPLQAGTAHSSNQNKQEDETEQNSDTLNNERT